MLSKGELGVFTYQATDTQNSSLRQISASWGDEFWSFDEIVTTQKNRDLLILFVSEEQSSTNWQGVLIAELGLESADLLFVYVDQNARKNSLGKRLLQTLTKKLQEKQKKALLLEVRDSNESAKALYQTFGMKLIDRRKRYYSNGEDALIYQMLIGN